MLSIPLCKCPAKFQNPDSSVHKKSKNRKNFALSAMALHLLAMGIMLLDHIGATLLPEQEWLRGVGRLAFPIFAFMIVEGYYHTRSLKRYVMRLLIFALIAEVPFDMMVSGSPIYLGAQNVLWTFLMGLALIFLLEHTRKTDNIWLRLLAAGGAIILAVILGSVTRSDYHYAGIFTVLVFYCFRGYKWWHFLGQLLCILYIHTEVLSGYAYTIDLLGHVVHFPRQGLAVLGLIPIWLYRGEQGRSGKGLRFLCYAFYPAHMLILSILRML